MKQAITLFVWILVIGAWSLPVSAQVVADDVQCAGCVDTRDIARGAIESNRIADQAVRTRQLHNGAVTTSKLRDGAVTGPKLGPDVAASIAALEARVTQLASQPQGPRVLANGVVIGQFLGLSPGSEPAHFVLSPTDYVFRIVAASSSTAVAPGQIVGFRLYFETTDCSGQAYFNWSDVFRLGVAPPAQGVVTDTRDSSGDLGNLFYAPPSQAVVQRAMWSGISQSVGCERESGGLIESLSAYPNDPAVTGVPNEPFTPPITIGQ